MAAAGARSREVDLGYKGIDRYRLCSNGFGYEPRGELADLDHFFP